MILYFSATGNSKYCAEKLAVGANDTLVSINDYMKNGISNFDCSNEAQLGIVCPTYDFDMS